MTQAELDAGTAIVNTATVTGTGATPDSDDASVAVAQSKILHIEKDATVPDGTANSTSDVINYTLAVTNQGNAAIANVVVDDPFTTNEAPVLSGAFNIGDTDQDNLLDVGETWQYTASHTVTQAELDAGCQHRQHGDGDRHRGDPGQRRRLGCRWRRARSCTSRRTLRFAVGTADVDRRRHQLHAGGDQHRQCGDCQCGGGRSVHDQRGAGAVRRLQCRRHRPGQSAGCRRDLAVHGQPSGDAGRAGRRDQHRQHGDGDRHRGDPGQRRRLGCGCAEQDPAHREGRDGSGRHGRTRPATSSTTRWR